MLKYDSAFVLAQDSFDKSDLNSLNEEPGHGVSNSSLEFFPDFELWFQTHDRRYEMRTGLKEHIQRERKCN